MAAKTKSIHGARKSVKFKSLSKSNLKLKLNSLRSKCKVNTFLPRIRMEMSLLKANCMKKSMFLSLYGRFKPSKARITLTSIFKRPNKKYGILSLWETLKSIQPKSITLKILMSLMMRLKELYER